MILIRGRALQARPDGLSGLFGFSGVTPGTCEYIGNSTHEPPCALRRRAQARSD
jgi:hypothetical protein